MPAAPWRHADWVEIAMTGMKNVTRRVFMDRAAKTVGLAIAAIIGLPAIGLGIASATGGAMKTLVRVGRVAQLGPEPVAVPISYVARDAWRQSQQQGPQDDDEILQRPECCKECIQLLARLLLLPGVSLRPTESKLRDRRRERIQQTHAPPGQQRSHR